MIPIFTSLPAAQRHERKRPSVEPIILPTPHRNISDKKTRSKKQEQEQRAQVTRSISKNQTRLPSPLLYRTLSQKSEKPRHPPVRRTDAGDHDRVRVPAEAALEQPRQLRVPVRDVNVVPTTAGAATARSRLRAFRKGRYDVPQG